MTERKREQRKHEGTTNGTFNAVHVKKITASLIITRITFYNCYLFVIT
uniref:Uncharacterized protein n=1 Tax=Arundo donax TaxID=35708 RepID=A0A0A9EAR6_ARUDO